MDKSFAAQVTEFLRNNHPKEATIGELVDLVEAGVGIPDEFRERATIESTKATIRRAIKQLRDKDGMSEFESIERPNEDGTTTRKYVNLTLFDKEDYRVAISYHAERSRYHGRKANALTQRCNEQHEVQYELPFPEFEPAVIA